MQSNGSDDCHEAVEDETHSAVHILEQGEQWAEKDGDFVFNKTKVIFRQRGSVFMATTDKREPELKALNMDDLERIRIPRGDVCPHYKKGLTRAPVPIPGEIYVKRPRLLSWEPGASDGIASLVLQEAEAGEILRKHPHPRIAQYHGCLVEDGRITGLCYKKYESDLESTLAARKDITEQEKLAYLEAVRDGLQHLHQLGLAHNDINPSNIMMDDGKPVSIDFDSTRRIGVKLGSKAGTFEWELEGAEFSEPENDFYGLDKIQRVTLRLEPTGRRDEDAS